MRQRFWSRFTAVLAVLVLAAGGVVAQGILPGSSTPAYADLDDFRIESFHADYVLGRDDDGRSTLRTAEHIVAVFPDFDQNRGLIRDLTRVYDDHDTDIRVLSVTDENGTPRSYSTEEYGDFLSVTMAVPQGSYVHGEQHYVIEYEQRDVTRFFDDTGADEFYWDLNGTEWRQPFDSVSATVTVTDGLQASLSGASACYQGEFRSSERCDITSEESGGETTFSVDVEDLGPGENVSIAVGFDEGTFKTARAPWWERLPTLLIGGITAFVGAIVTYIVSIVRGRKSKTGRAIISQYEPPEGIDVPLASEILGTQQKTMTASLLDLAVRGKLRLTYDESSDDYGIVSVDSSGLSQDEAWLNSRLFGTMKTSTPVDPGMRVTFSQKSVVLGDTSAALKTRAEAEAKRRGLMLPTWFGARFLFNVLMIVGGALIGLHLMLRVSGDSFTVVAALVAFAFVTFWGKFSVKLSKSKRLTEKGALLKDYLEGLREYIRLAEADRIRMLQSASGAEVSEQQIVQIYERLLPYAVLFGFEREWQNELKRYYRESSPAWVEGSDTHFVMFNVANFERRVATSPVTRTSSRGGAGSSRGSFSSFSGGSSGGGFSGGGGGGGGGRGI